MKTKHRLMIAGIAVAVGIITAGQPMSDWSKAGPPHPGALREGKQGSAEEKAGTKKECYSQSDLKFLMESNGWSEAAAKEVLELACEHAVTD